MEQSATPEISENARELLRVVSQRTAKKLPPTQDLFRADQETHQIWRNLVEVMANRFGRFTARESIKLAFPKLTEYDNALRLSKKQSPEEFFPEIKADIQKMLKQIAAKLT